MSDNDDYYSSDCEQPEPSVAQNEDEPSGVERKPRSAKPKKQASAQKLEQLRKAREAKSLKRLEKLKQPPLPPKHDPPAQEHDDQKHDAVETVYVKKRTNAKKKAVELRESLDRVWMRYDDFEEFARR